MTHPNKPLPSGKRRLLITSLVGGSAVAPTLISVDSWTKPMVQSLLLPAHGQTSGPPLVTQYAVTYTYGGRDIDTNDDAEDVFMEFSVNAEGDTADVVATASDDGTMDNVRPSRDGRQWRVTFVKTDSWFRLSNVPCATRLTTGGNDVAPISVPHNISAGCQETYGIGINPPLPPTTVAPSTTASP